MIAQKTNKKKLLIKLLVTCFVVLVLAGPALVSAQNTNYTTHERIPGENTTNNFPIFLGQLFNFAIGASALLAMFMIGFGAFNYIVTSAGNAAKMAEAKDMIYSAIFGLVIILISWILLFLINPDLVGGDINTNVPDGTGGIYRMPTVDDCVQRVSGYCTDAPVSTR